MAAPEPAELKVLRQAFRIAYGVGILLCVLWPLALELLLGRIIEPGTQPFEGVLWEIGCTFTLLSMAIALFAWALFGEAIGAAQFVGGAVVLAGIWLARRGS